MTKSDPAVAAHVNMMQDIIKRMAGNSVSCKQWCIVTVSALLTFSKSGTRCDDLSSICLIPLILFCFMDCYYLGIERQMRNRLNHFVSRLNANENLYAELFTTELLDKKSLCPCEKLCKWVEQQIFQLWNTLKAFISFSIFPFYICLFVLIKNLE